MGQYQFVSTVVATKRPLTERVQLIELTAIDEWKLPPFEAGAHVDVHLPSGTIRQYSLCSDPAIRNRYRIAVLRDERGRGGSTEIIDQVRQGDLLSLSLPRNLFPLDLRAKETVLVAGGIGITPMMSMIPVLQRAGRDFKLYFCTRDRGDTPFLQELDHLIRTGDAVLHHDNGEPELAINFKDLISRHGKNTHYYCCGPAGFLDAYLDATADLPKELVHLERFLPPPIEIRPAFTLKLLKSERTFEVREGESIAEALSRNGVKIKTGCLAGICGLCRVPYVSGKVVHRDHLMSEEERTKMLTTCVSGCDSKELVVDI
jgi:ferredoxin-NADP reductase